MVDNAPVKRQRQSRMDGHPCVEQVKALVMVGEPLTRVMEFANSTRGTLPVLNKVTLWRWVKKRKIQPMVMEYPLAVETGINVTATLATGLLSKLNPLIEMAMNLLYQRQRLYRMAEKEKGLPFGALTELRASIDLYQRGLHAYLEALQSCGLIPRQARAVDLNLRAELVDGELYETFKTLWASLPMIAEGRHGQGGTDGGAGAVE